MSSEECLTGCRDSRQDIVLIQCNICQRGGKFENIEPVGVV